jgi:hypothetical protein
MGPPQSPGGLEWSMAAQKVSCRGCGRPIYIAAAGLARRNRSTATARSPNCRRRATQVLLSMPCGLGVTRSTVPTPCSRPPALPSSWASSSLYGQLGVPRSRCQRGCATIGGRPPSRPRRRSRRRTWPFGARKPLLPARARGPSSTPRWPRLGGGRCRVGSASIQWCPRAECCSWRRALSRSSWPSRSTELAPAYVGAWRDRRAPEPRAPQSLFPPGARGFRRPPCASLRPCSMKAGRGAVCRGARARFLHWP